MVWVRSEYAGELAVLSAWLCALMPWNVTYSPNVAGGSFLFVRFPFFQVRYNYGVPFGRSIAVTDAVSAFLTQLGHAPEAAYGTWLGGAALVAAALVLSVVYYRREAVVESGPVDPVRLMGALLVAAGLVLSLSTYLLATRGFRGLAVPIGVAFMLALGAVLLRVDRAPAPGDDAAAKARANLSCDESAADTTRRRGHVSSPDIRAREF